MHIIATFLLANAALALSSFAAGAQTVVGVWEDYPVMNTQYKPVARPHFIFTNARLTEKTVFTALRDDGSELEVLCCMVVKNTTPIVLADVVKKYAIDPGFGEQMNSVKGAAFIYEAVPIEPSAWSRAFKVIMKIDHTPDDGSPYSAGVVGVRLADATSLKRQFKAGADDVSLQVSYPRDKNTIRYEFKVNGKRTIMSEAAQPHD